MILDLPPITLTDGHYHISVPALGCVRIVARGIGCTVTADISIETASELLGQLAQALTAARGREVRIDDLRGEGSAAP